MNDLGPYKMEKHYYPSIKDAGNMVGLDLENPIDCSQMDVYEISSVPRYDDYNGQSRMERKTVLHAFVFNEYGEREELTITFELLSQRRPKPKENV